MGLETGPVGHLDAVAVSSENAWAAAAGLEYVTVSVLMSELPSPSRATTWRRALRRDSLANFPLQRSRVAAWAETWSPLSSSWTVTPDPTSFWVRPTPDSPGGKVVPGAVLGEVGELPAGGDPSAAARVRPRLAR